MSNFRSSRKGKSYMERSQTAKEESEERQNLVGEVREQGESYLHFQRAPLLASDQNVVTSGPAGGRAVGGEEAHEG
ncbi:hypothetical protein KFK09_001217 [Dendrobium nobile]|uniref:Uncharacterized protein n=1 Tax=Dendrobium nobile TaxID=94219 RepID=A0A8T3CA78_DENNO|nr:hypothetical protein KFK09_001217 [Dendrobium nobile]